MDKPTLRRWLRRRRFLLSLQEIQKKGQLIAQRVLSWAAFHQAKRVLLYSPIDGEVDTALIWQTALQEGKETYFPRVCREKGQIEFVYTERKESLRPGTYGILEPLGERVFSAQEDLATLVLVPGLAFDLQGYRLGWGGGYYDRALPQLAGSTLRVGLAYEFQVFSSLPYEEGDEKVDCVVTETRFLACSPGRVPGDPKTNPSRL